MTIVCVDDHPVTLKGLAQSVRCIRPEANTYAFENADDAISFVIENGCDVLISEIELAGVDGLTLAKKIKNLNPTVNIIFLTVILNKSFIGNGFFAADTVINMNRFKRKPDFSFKHIENMKHCHRIASARYSGNNRRIFINQ